MEEIKFIYIHNVWLVILSSSEGVDTNFYNTVAKNLIQCDFFYSLSKVLVAK